MKAKQHQILHLRRALWSASHEGYAEGQHEQAEGRPREARKLLNPKLENVIIPRHSRCQHDKQKKLKAPKYLP